MKLTNKLGLPQALVDCVKNDPYDNGGAWRSVTQLIAPPRIIALKKQYDEEIEQDVSERLYMMYGQIVHSILERANVVDLVEGRVFLKKDGLLLSGAFDSLQFAYSGKYRLSDWKFSTAWKAVGETMEWEEQMNLLRYFLLHGFWDAQCTKPTHVDQVDELEVVLLMRDHQKKMAKRDSKYPKLPIARLPFPLWDDVTIERFLSYRIKLHQAAETLLPHCSALETWARPTLYAIMKEGRKSAVRLFVDENALRQYWAKKEFSAPEYQIEIRPGERVRCEHYCLVNKFCSQYQETLNDLSEAPTNS